MQFAGKHILLVEDNPDDVFLLQAAIRRAGVPVDFSVVTDGEEAIEWLSRNINQASQSLPDLLITDLKMPRKNGFELVEWLCTQPGCEKIPVVILSSSDQLSDLLRASNLKRVTRYFCKSMAYPDLIQFLKEQEGAPQPNFSASQEKHKAS
jgi:CheY-like chemotaxis protein